MRARKVNLFTTELAKSIDRHVSLDLVSYHLSPEIYAWMEPSDNPDVDDADSVGHKKFLHVVRRKLYKVLQSGLVSMMSRNIV